MSEFTEPIWAELKRRKLTPIQLLREFRILAPPVDVRRLAEDMGVPVASMPLEGCAGWIGFDDVGLPSIVVNSAESEVRQRFTIAHEIGHLILHPRQKLHRDTTFRGDAREVAANRYAAQLLMPHWMVEVAAAHHGHNAASLANVFRVSEQTMALRLKMMAGQI